MRAKRRDSTDVRLGRPVLETALRRDGIGLSCSLIRLRDLGGVGQSRVYCRAIQGSPDSSRRFFKSGAADRAASRDS